MCIWKELPADSLEFASEESFSELEFPVIDVEDVVLLEPELSVGSDWVEEIVSPDDQLDELDDAVESNLLLDSLLERLDSETVECEEELEPWGGMTMMKRLGLLDAVADVEVDDRVVGAMSQHVSTHTVKVEHCNMSETCRTAKSPHPPLTAKAAQVKTRACEFEPVCMDDVNVAWGALELVSEDEVAEAELAAEDIDFVKLDWLLSLAGALLCELIPPLDSLRLALPSETLERYTADPAVELECELLEPELLHRWPEGNLRIAPSYGANNDQIRLRFFTAEIQQKRSLPVSASPQQICPPSASELQRNLVAERRVAQLQGSKPKTTTVSLHEPLKPLQR